ncbi:MAG TPA: YihY/virulence factor BrkB family protein [Pirellulales bacterium]|jgi:membrane protein
MFVQFFDDVRQSVARLYADDGPLMAAATAYYVGLSFFPLLLLLTAALGWFLKYSHLGQDAHAEVLNFVKNNTSELLAQYVSDSLTMVQDRSSINGPIGLATIVLTSLAAFAQLDSAFDRIWRVPPSESKSIFWLALNFLIQRGRAFLLLLGLMTLVMLVFFAGMILTAVESHTANVLPAGGWQWDAVQVAVTLATNAVVFTLLFRLLPKAPVRWGHSLHGGLLTAAAWEIGRQILAVMIARGKYGTAYGVIGAFLAVLLWCYYAVTIVLVGAEYIQVLDARQAANAKERPELTD